MDRRDFLKTTGAAAVAAGTAVSTAHATGGRAGGASRPARQPGCSRSARSGRPSLRVRARAPGASHRDGHRRPLSHRDRARHGRCRSDLRQRRPPRQPAPGLRLLRRPALRARASTHLPSTPGWRSAAGRCCGTSLPRSSASSRCWPVTPAPVPACGPARGWRRPADLARATLHVEGLAADALRALGATPVQLAPHELRAALAAGRIQAAEWLGPLAARRADLQPLAQRLYEPGFHRGGMALSLAVRRSVWEAMSAADRAIFEACAAQEYQLSLAEARAHALLAGQVADVRRNGRSGSPGPIALPRPSTGRWQRSWSASPPAMPARAASTTATRRSATCWART